MSIGAVKSVGAIADNLRRVEERMAQAAQRSGRPPETLTLILASKTVPAERLREAVEAGGRHVGENYVQEARAKRAALADLPAQWHMIGHLQRNKAKDAIGLFDVIQSLDNLRLAQELSRRAQQAERVVRALVEVNIGLEDTKFGVLPQDLLFLLEEVCRLPNLVVEGLMTLGPLVSEPEQARPAFVTLRQLGERVSQASLPNVVMRHLSMGMSSDFEVAIEEGATMVRVGTAIFGPRK